MQDHRDFTSDEDARAAIGAAVRHLLSDTAGVMRETIVRGIVEMVREVANDADSPDARVVRHAPMNRVTYKAYTIDAYRRDVDRWRATIRRLDGKKIRVAVPPSVQDETTTSLDALTAEKAVEFAKKAIDGGQMM
jgi:hypothetical protein